MGVWTLLWTCDKSRLHTPYENLMPGDLRWSWGGDASAGERLQIQIIISREVWLHRGRNQLLADSYENLSVSGNWQLNSIWWQALQWQVSCCTSSVQLHLVAALSQNLTIILVCASLPIILLTTSIRTPFPHCILVSVTVLVSPHASPSQNQ